MDNTNYTTEHRKGQHLLNEERHEIEVRLKDGWSVYRIARHLGRPNNMIGNAKYKSEHDKLQLEYQKYCISRNRFRILFEENNIDGARLSIIEYGKTVDDPKYSSFADETGKAVNYRLTAKLAYKAKEFDKACDSLIKAYEIYLKYYGANYPHTIDILERLAAYYSESVNQEKAQKYF